MTKTTMILHSESLGRGSDELGKTMTGAFLRKLWASAKKPDTIIFYNSAVHLLTDKSSVLDALTGSFQGRGGSCRLSNLYRFL